MWTATGKSKRSSSPRTRSSYTATSSSASHQVTEYEADSKGINIGVDVADINGNGMPEIIVTRLTLTRKTLASFALEWDGKAFRRIVDNAPWYFRVCDLPDRGKVLLGQEPRHGSPFKGKIFEMIWRNGQYEPETPITVSTAANVLGLTIGQIVKGQRETIAAYDPSDRIRVFDEAGKEEWQSAERYGGSTLHTLGNIDDPGANRAADLSAHAPHGPETGQGRKIPGARHPQLRHCRPQARDIPQFQRGADLRLRVGRAWDCSPSGEPAS